jgi:outer membrane cobalamin receptor
MRRLSAVSLLFVSSLISPPPASAGTLAGSVRTPDGTGLPHLLLTLVGPGGPRQVVTGPDGRFRAELPDGEYALAVEAPGFVLSPEPRVSVGPAGARADLVLAPAPVRERVAVSATRGEAAVSTLGIAVSTLDREAIASREASSVLQLLQDLPGLAMARTGGIGSQGSVFVRGGESRYARILVDGVPVNQPGGAFDFGSALPLELERVELVRGAASSLYGTDALAGVVHFVTRRAGPSEAPGLHAEAEGGSFSWRRGLVGTSGRAGRLDWNAGLLRLETDNDAPNSRFEASAASASVGVSFGSRTALHLLARGEDNAHGTPGPTAFGRPDSDASFERRDLVLGARLRRVGDRATHELRAGLAATDQLSLNPEDSGCYLPRSADRAGAFPICDFAGPEGFRNDSRRASAGYQIELQVGSRHLLTAGAEAERETGGLGRGADLLEPGRTNFGLYLQDRVLLGERVFATLGGRLERNGSFGTRAVPRAAVAVRLRGGADATTLRASAGAGIKEPTFTESYGVSFFAQGNPDLEPERSRTFDVGVEQRLAGGRVRAEAALFHHDYRDQIAYAVLDFTTFRGSFVNLGRARARGAEVSLDASPTRHLQIAAHYTYLDGEILVATSAFDPVYAAGRELLRRPRHQASFTLRGGTERFGGGATLVLVGRRADSDFLGLGLEENAGYARLDARLRVRLARGLEGYLVGENLLDRSYQEALGYPAPGRSIRLGLRFRTPSPRP